MDNELQKHLMDVDNQANERFELILPSFEAGVTNVNALLNSDIKGVLNKDTTAMMDMLSLVSGSSYFIDGKISSSVK